MINQLFFRKIPINLVELAKTKQDNYTQRGD